MMVTLVVIVYNIITVNDFPIKLTSIGIYTWQKKMMQHLYHFCCKAETGYECF